MEAKNALVLSGGGARAAYQVGVLRAVSDILQESKHPGAAQPPFNILTGFSAGAINCGALAGRVRDFKKVTEDLWRLWENITPDQIFKTDILNVAGVGAKWISRFLFGGMPSGGANYLLDSAPLKKLVTEIVDFEGIRNGIQSGILKGVAVSATNYHSGATVTFFDGNEASPSRQESLYRAVSMRLGVEHILASCAIPVLFPPVKVENCYYGDGGIRFSAPLSPAIHFGADRIFTIGLRHSSAVESCAELSRKRAPRAPGLAEVLGVLMNAAFAEALAADVDRAIRVNEMVEAFKQRSKGTGFKEIPIFLIEPSIDLADLAFKLYRKFPLALKYVLRGIGASQKRGWDFLSYLAFDQSYTSRLLRLGYDDGMAKKREILEFLVGGEELKRVA